MLEINFFFLGGGGGALGGSKYLLPLLAVKGSSKINIPGSKEWWPSFPPIVRLMTKQSSIWSKVGQRHS